MFDFPHAYIQTYRSSIWLAESKKFGISIGQSQMHVIDNKIFKNLTWSGLVDLRLKSFSSYRSFFISIFRDWDINKAMDTALEVVRLIMEYFGLERDALIGVSL